MVGNGLLHPQMEALGDIEAEFHPPEGDAAPPEPPKPAIDQNAAKVAAAMQSLAKDIPFVQTATRPLNIVASAIKKELDFGQDTAALNSPEGEALLQASKALDDRLREAVSNENASALCEALKALEAPINAFFESTMVMSENVAERNSRLALLARVSKQLQLAGDFARIVVEG